MAAGHAATLAKSANTVFIVLFNTAVPIFQFSFFHSRPTPSHVGSAGLTHQTHKLWPAGFYGAAHNKKIKPCLAPAGHIYETAVHLDCQVGHNYVLVTRRVSQYVRL